MDLCSGSKFLCCRIAFLVTRNCDQQGHVWNEIRELVWRRAPVLSHAVRQRHTQSWAWATPMLVCKYVVQIGLATMLATKRSAGVTPDLNLRNPLHLGDKTPKQGNPPWLWSPGQMLPEAQNGLSVAPEKGLMSSKNFFQKNKRIKVLNSVHTDTRVEF